MIVRDILTVWKIRVDDRDIKKLDKSIKNARERLEKFGDSMTKIGGFLTVGVTLPILGAGAAFIKAASDAEESFTKFATVFSGIEQQADSIADNLKKNFGLSSTAAKTLLGDTGDLLTGFGFTQKMALRLSRDVNELAVDLASFTNFSGGAEGASKALTKALLGERESVKSLGISILEEDVKARVRQLRSQGKLLDATERQAKAFATLTIAQEQSKNAIGDFARTNKGFANQIRILMARLSDLAVSFGQIMLPAANRVVGVLIDLLEFFTSLNEGTKEFIIIMGLAAAVMGPLALGLGLATKAVLLLTGSFVGLQLTALATPLLIGLAIVALGLIVEDVFSFMRGDLSLTGAAFQGFQDFMEGMAMSVVSTFRFMSNGLMPILDAVVAAIDNAGLALRKMITILSSGAALKVIDFFSSIGGSALPEDFVNFLEGSTEAVGATSKAPNVLDAATIKGGTETSSVDINISAPMQITVPQGTPPELVGDAVTAGVRDGIERMLRDAQEVTEPKVFA